jgi:hypothetical protein
MDNYMNMLGLLRVVKVGWKPLFFLSPRLLQEGGQNSSRVTHCNWKEILMFSLLCSSETMFLLGRIKMTAFRWLTYPRCVTSAGETPRFPDG